MSEVHKLQKEHELLIANNKTTGFTEYKVTITGYNKSQSIKMTLSDFLNVTVTFFKNWNIL